MRDLPAEDPLDTAIGELARECDSLIICAGAGMGVDSGLPDFRGDQGFWKAYPALGEAGIRFVEIANPAAFDADPQLAWGFYGHRLRLYRETRPHAGFGRLLDLGRRLGGGVQVFTSNVDGQFQRAGYDAATIAECHGSIHRLQCSRPCGTAIWPADDWQPQVDVRACRLRSPLPRCPHCGAVARPNVLMFEDGRWISDASDAQQQRLIAWLARARRPLAVEIGAGTHVATVRYFAESLGCPMIRINPQDAGVRRGIGLALPALAGIERIVGALSASLR